MKLSFKMWAALLVAAGLLLTGISLSFRIYQQVAVTAEARKHAALVIASADEFLSSLKDAETGQRGFLLTGDEAFLQPYFAVHDGVDAQLQNLQQMVHMDAAKRHLDALVPLVQANMAELEHSIAIGRAHNTAEVLRLVNSGKGKQQMDAIREQLRAFVQIEETGQAESEAEYQATLGKMACGIIVQDAQGQQISFLNAFGRFFAKILSALILCIGFIMVAFSKEKQSLHDMIASTYVVYK